MFKTDQPDRSTRDAILALAAELETADGTGPLNESATLVVRGERPGTFYISLADDVLAGFAVADPREATIVAGVRPSHRRRGLGSGLLSAALDDFGDYSVWAFGTQPGAVGLAEHLGLVAARGLLKLGRALGEERVGPIPEGYRITTYHDSDAEQVVAVNAAAFAHHPEQGKLTVEEFHGLTLQPWFSPEGLFVGRQGDEVAGFHWTKRHDADNGEVYVLAVHPDHGGVGLGRVLLETGLAHLEDIGCKAVHLYVEAEAQRVVRMYRSANFEQINLDTSYRREDA
ncbi:mycothiol synthase [Tessaracoccus sp. OS52]|uniref:mycothiol synthase n=1 Tax=Tessaracoccus sp. OS52 TaxID=2886691 RepID=UPI001D102DEA|nr:mycothiol synthase [Tessaracoccus sp. OS52]MCC2594632.1 mycothiol synthase [Tessaracoccus sp. OS52]